MKCIEFMIYSSVVGSWCLELLCVASCLSGLQSVSLSVYLSVCVSVCLSILLTLPVYNNVLGMFTAFSAYN